MPRAETESTSNSTTKKANIIKKVLSTSGTIYKVQVKASSIKRLPNDDVFKQLGEIEESFEDNLYKYLVGNYNSEAQAHNRKEEVKAMGINDAFVVKYVDGKRVK